MSETSSDTPMDDAYTIGAILRGAREANGETIEDVARMLRINWRYLQALEEGQFHQLPGTVYAIGFIRTYADHLGMDSADLIDRYKAVSSSSPNKPSLEFPEPIPESGLPGGAILFAGIVVAILAYGGWYLATEEDSFLARMVSPVPEHLAEEEQTTASAETVPQPATVETAEETQPEAEEQTPEQDVAVEQPEEPTEPTEPTEPVEETSDASTQMADEQATVAETAEETVVETVVEVSAEISEEVAGAVQTEEETTEQMASETAAETEAVVEQVAVIEEEPVLETVADVVETTEEDAAVADVSESVNSEAEPASLSETVADGEEKADTLSLNEAQLQAVQETLSGEVVDEPEVETGTEVELEADPVSESEATMETTATEVTAIEGADQQGTDVASGVSSDNENTQVAAIPAEEPVSETASGRVYGDQDNARIVVRAKANSWIQVRNDNSGQLLLTRLLRAGDEYHVPDQSGLSLLTGNAGALEILVDGSAVPAIGSSGDVRRNVVLDADRLKSGDAAN